MLPSVFDVVWRVDGVKHTYTFTTESEANRFAKGLEEQGYEPYIFEWDPS